MKKLRIGIEIDDKTYHNKDFSKLLDGNPGVGGIHYQMLMLGLSLHDFYENCYDITYFHYEKSNKFPYGTHEKLCDNSVDALRKAEVDSIDYYISSCNQSNEWYEVLRTLDLKVLVRAGCYLDKHEVDNVMKTLQVVRVIAVSSEEYDYYMDHDIQERMICVENSMSYASVRRRNENAFDAKCVTYIGAMVPQKGFYRLAKIWPRVLKKVPDAKLKVIGSAKLYSSEARLGRYGIAEEKYENHFMKYLVDSKGNILPSVEFLGLVEGGKGNILFDTSVGVVNPIAKTECCCTSSIDFAASGIPVVTCGRQGLPSTVINNKTGMTFLSTYGFYRKLVKLLTSEKLNRKLGSQAEDFAQYFDRGNMVHIWNKELSLIAQGKEVAKRKDNGNYYNDGKWFKVINRFFRKKCGLSFLPATIDWIQWFYDFCHAITSLFRQL